MGSKARIRTASVECYWNYQSKKPQHPSVTAAEEIEKNDRFWLYVGALVLALLTTLAIVKKSESDKFEPIKQQLEEEAALMNIRVLN